MPAKAEPTPRYHVSVLNSIEEELKKPRHERSLPSVTDCAKIREYACVPDVKRIKRTKGKVKSSIKHKLLSAKTDDFSEVLFVDPFILTG
jgi:hypothetical protein